MFTVEIGLVAFLGAGLGWHLKPNFSWLADQVSLTIYKFFLIFGFLSCVYCILAGLNLFATGYMDAVAKPAFDKISTNPESLNSVHSPRAGIALVMIFFAPVTLLLWGSFFGYIYYLAFKEWLR